MALFFVSGFVGVPFGILDFVVGFLVAVPVLVKRSKTPVVAVFVVDVVVFGGVSPLAVADFLADVVRVAGSLVVVVVVRAVVVPPRFLTTSVVVVVVVVDRTDRVVDEVRGVVEVVREVRVVVSDEVDEVVGFEVLVRLGVTPPLVVVRGVAPPLDARGVVDFGVVVLGVADLVGVSDLVVVDVRVVP